MNGWLASVMPPQGSFFGCAVSQLSRLSNLCFDQVPPILIWALAWWAMISFVKHTAWDSDCPQWFAGCLIFGINKDPWLQK